MDIFRKSIHFLAARHESLRTAFEKEEEILQIVHPDVVPVITFTTLPVGDSQALQALMKEEIQRPFNLEVPPLFRITCAAVAPNDHYVLFCMHHLIADGWSLQIFIRELSVVYQTFVNGQKPVLAELPLQYADYVLWQQQIADTTLLQQLAYWESQLQTAPALLELPADHIRPVVQTFSGDAVRVSLTAPLAGKLMALCGELHTTPYLVLLSAFNVLLYHYTGQADIVVGSPMANRSRQEFEGIIGLFVNTLPLRSKLLPEMDFRSLVAASGRTVQEAMAHQDVALEKILEVLPQSRVAGHHPLFQVMFSLHSFGNESIQWEGLETEMYDTEGFFSKFDITLSVKADQGNFHLVWEYNTDIFRRETIQRMSQYFNYVLEQVSATPAILLRDIQLVDAPARQQLLFGWNDTAKALPEGRFDKLFASQVLLHPEAIAVRDALRAWTYTQLEQDANRLAHLLLSNGISRGATVAICMERSGTMLVALLAVMKAGGVYVPIDPVYPAERRAYLLEDAGIRYVITQQRLEDLFAGKDHIQLISPDNESARLAEQPLTAPVQAGDATDPVYMIYTSGSTGRPKGVRIAHTALVNFLYSIIACPGINQSDRLLAVTSLSFDIAGLELYAPLLAGATVVIAGREVVNNAASLIDCLTLQEITIMQATPATWRILQDAGWEGSRQLKALCGGEAFPRSLAGWLSGKAAEVWNMYGPTETTIWSTIYRVLPGDSTTVPLGMPIANTTCYIFNEALQPVPIGVNGELYIGGKGLAIDYYNRPELTAERFIVHPFLPGERLYKTGDKARYQPDGNIVFAGRTDFQIKVNGHRIEPGEIEYHLSQVAGVKEAVVVAVKDQIGLYRLRAYVILNSPGIETAAIKESLLRLVPAYMVPTQWSVVTAFPLTPNGKTDRMALQERELETATEQLYEPPATQEETILQDIWQEVLGLSHIGVNDNFFELGGASLQCINVCTKATAYAMLIKPEQLFEFQTIRELARKVSVMQGVHAVAMPADNLVLSVNDLSDGVAAEVQEMKQAAVHIESFACFLPEKVVSTAEILDGCVNTIRFPMQRLTGIHSRRETVEDECAFGMAVKAMEHCFNMSRYVPEEIDVLISCNVFRMDHPRELVVEPGMAIRLARRMGCGQALTMDISNACAGVFTAILMAETLIRNNTAKRVMLVSGEYLTHLTSTAQQEIIDYMDLSISALTVGDSGLAMILEAAPAGSTGLAAIDMFTMGGYSDLCVVKRTEQEDGGLLLKTNAIRMAEAGHLEASRHAWNTLQRNGWGADTIDFLIMHQASSTTTTNTMRQVNRLLNNDFANKENTIDNIRHRGNTATTTHWMAIQDSILDGKIQNDDRAVLFISGSGLNIGTALYGFDTLPERVRDYWHTGKKVVKRAAVSAVPVFRTGRSGVQIVSRALSRPGIGPASAINMATAAADQCLQQQTDFNKSDIGLLIYGGIYRDEHLYEPAISTIIAGALSVNAMNNEVKDGSRTLCFDIFNSDLAWLQACFMATEFLKTGKTSYALLTTGEMENNAEVKGAPLLNVQEGGAAVLLQSVAGSRKGFGAFMFHNDPVLANDVYTWVKLKGKHSQVFRKEQADRQELLLQPLQNLVMALLKQEGIAISDLYAIVPPFPGAAFIASLRQMLQVPAHVIIPGGDDSLLMASLSIPLLLDGLLERHLPEGAVILLLSTGAGHQLGGCLYHC